MRLKSFLTTALLLASLTALTGCYQVHSDDADLRTVPVTNNPNIVPQQTGVRMPSGPSKM